MGLSKIKMVNKKLAEWIKNEEVQGYSDDELERTLLKRGYAKEEVEKAILYLRQKFHLKALLHIPLYLIIAFFVSLLFLGWAFGEFVNSIILSAVLIINVLIMDFFDKKNMDLVSWTFLVVLYIVFLFTSPLFFIVAIASFILAIGLFFKENKQINLYLINMSLLISLFITATIIFLTYLGIIYGIIPLLPTISSVYLLLLFLPLIYAIPPLIFFFNNLCLSKIKIN